MQQSSCKLSRLVSRQTLLYECYRNYTVKTEVHTILSQYTHCLRFSVCIGTIYCAVHTFIFTVYVSCCFVGVIFSSVRQNGVTSFNTDASYVLTEANKVGLGIYNVKGVVYNIIVSICLHCQYHVFCLLLKTIIIMCYICQ